MEQYRLTVSQFLRLCDSGIFPEGQHVELLDGLIATKMVKNPPHNFTVGELDDCLRMILPAGWHVGEEKSIQIGRHSLPEPDNAIVRGRRRDYTRRHPGPRDLALIVEVSDTSYAKDRHAKWVIYAAARIPIYWIVNLPERRVEVYSEPAGRGETARYTKTDIYEPRAAVPVVLDGREVGRIAVNDILP